MYDFVNLPRITEYPVEVRRNRCGYACGDVQSSQRYWTELGLSSLIRIDNLKPKVRCAENCGRRDHVDLSGASERVDAVALAMRGDTPPRRSLRRSTLRGPT